MGRTKYNSTRLSVNERRDSRFLRNELCVGNDYFTETKFLRCEIADSVQDEIMIIGGRQLFEDCLIRSTAPVAIRLVYSEPGFNRPMALKEIQASGKDPDIQAAEPPLPLSQSTRTVN